MNLSQKKPTEGQKVYNREDMWHWGNLIPEGTEFTVKDVESRSAVFEYAGGTIVVDLERSGIHFTTFNPNKSIREL